MLELTQVTTYPLVSLSDVSREVVHRDILLTIWAVGLLTQVDALNVVVEQFLGLELLLAVGTLVVADLLVEILDMVIQILVLLVTDVAGGGLRQVNLLDVVLQSILGHKLLLTQGTFSDLNNKMLKFQLHNYLHR